MAEDSKKLTLEQDQLIQLPKSLLDLTSKYGAVPYAVCGTGETPCTGGQSCDAQKEYCGSCQNSCQTTCENYCQTECQNECQTNCERSCQYACENTCEVGCQVSCQTACEIASQAPKTRSTISILNITSDSATVYIVRNDASQIHIVIREAYGSQSTVWDTGTIGIGQPTASHTLTGLSPSTTYAYNLWDDVSGWGTTRYFTTPSAFIRFDWTYAGINSSGSAVYGSTKSAGLGVYVTASEWNELAGLIEDVTGSSVSRVTRGDAISASIVNTAARELGVSTVSRGEAITASFFNRLRTAYNNLG